MNNNQQPKEIHDEVLEQIRSGKLRMKPRLFFVLKAALVTILMVLILTLSVWLASFISFGLRLSGHESLLGFGARGIGIFVSIFPWWLALLDLLLIGLVSWLLRRFKFGYRKPVLYLLGGVLVCGVGAGLLFDRETSFHDDRLEEAEAGELGGPLESVYERTRQPAPEEYGIYRGYVVSTDERSFVITHDDFDDDDDDGSWTILPPRQFDMRQVQVGDRVYVAGEREGESIEAYGIKVLER
jgi:hypothetical protein